MNGYINNAEVFVPVPGFNFPGVKEVLQKYQERAKGQGIDPFGYNFVPYGYAAAQVLGMAVEATKSLDHAKVADALRSSTFKTVVGDVAFGKDGEWAKPRTVVTQWRNLTGNDLGQLTDLQKWSVVWPAEYRNADLVYPYEAAKK
jgi:branched-chain amino acid transport system substrate-binding protein